MLSTAEVETGSICHNGKVVVPICTIHSEIGHPQSPYPFKTDKTTIAGFLKSTITQKNSKSWDMNLHWMKDRILQKEFWIYWDKGYRNSGD